MKLMPASRARWMIRIESLWSVLPHAPNIIAPRHSGLTWTPVRPSERISIGCHSTRPDGAAPDEAHARSRPRGGHHARWAAMGAARGGLARWPARGGGADPAGAVARARAGVRGPCGRGRPRQPPLADAVHPRLRLVRPLDGLAARRCDRLGRVRSLDARARPRR